MITKIEKAEKNIVTLEITLGADKFAEAIKKSYSKNANNFNIPGFRKGKAPMNIIKRHYGEQVFYEDAINFCCESSYPEAIKENDIIPVDYPEIDVVQIGEGKDFIYTAKVVVRPEVELGEYKGIEVKKVEYPVTDEEVDAKLKAMQEKNGRIEDKTEGAIENGNIAIIDFKGYIDDVLFEGGEGKDYSLEIGSHSFIDTFEDQLIGLNIGDSKDVKVSFPAEYGKEELNGKVALFKVVIKDIKVKELPELDDEFAKEASEFDTLEELKNDVIKSLKEANDERSKREYEEAAIDVATKNATVDIPDKMIEKEIDGMIKDLETRLSYQGLDLKSYYEYTNNTEEKVRGFMKETAEKKVKTELILEKIAKVEALDTTEEELALKAEEMAGQYGSKDLEKTKKLILNNQKEYLKIEITNEKAIDLVVNSSKAI